MNIDIDAQDNHGNTPLMRTLDRKNCMEIFQDLLNKQANTEIKNTLGRTALMHAILSQKTEAVAALLKVGANTHAQDTQGLTVLKCAEIVNMLTALSNVAVGASSENQADYEAQNNRLKP